MGKNLSTYTSNERKWKNCVRGVESFCQLALILIDENRMRSAVSSRLGTGLGLNTMAKCLLIALTRIGGHKAHSVLSLVNVSMVYPHHNFLAIKTWQRGDSISSNSFSQRASSDSCCLPAISLRQHRRSQSTRFSQSSFIGRGEKRERVKVERNEICTVFCANKEITCMLACKQRKASAKRIPQSSGYLSMILWKRVSCMGRQSTGSFVCRE